MNILTNINSKIMPTMQQTDYIVGFDLLDNLHRFTQLKEKNFSSFLLLSDKTVFQLYGQKVFSSLKKLGKPIINSFIDPGEKSKNLTMLPKIIKPFIQKGFDRKSCLISLGGGIVTDIGGFLASIFLRGIPNINIPTTLLGQVDAAIGGKTGVDFWLSKKLMYKNMIGTFKQPNMVISDIETLTTLPEKEIINGLGEMVKYWIGWGKPIPKQLFLVKSSSIKNLMELANIISTCQQLKVEVIQQDPFEKLRLRQKLNLGHTIGHAIEGATKGSLSHGQAVARGLVACAKISFLKGLLSENNKNKIEAVIQKLDLPVNSGQVDKELILDALRLDKKGGTFVLIRDIGMLKVGVKVEKEIIYKVLKEIIV